MEVGSMFAVVNASAARLPYEPMTLTSMIERKTPVARDATVPPAITALAAAWPLTSGRNPSWA
jgi:hypothetical protein